MQSKNRINKILQIVKTNFWNRYTNQVNSVEGTRNTLNGQVDFFELLEAK